MDFSKKKNTHTHTQMDPTFQAASAKKRKPNLLDSPIEGLYLVSRLDNLFLKANQLKKLCLDI